MLTGWFSCRLIHWLVDQRASSHRLNNILLKPIQLLLRLAIREYLSTWLEFSRLFQSRAVCVAHRVLFLIHAQHRSAFHWIRVSALLAGDRAHLPLARIPSIRTADLIARSHHLLWSFIVRIGPAIVLVYDSLVLLMTDRETVLYTTTTSRRTCSPVAQLPTVVRFYGGI